MRRQVCVVALAMLGACSSSKSTTQTTADAQAAALVRRGGSNLITQSEISAVIGQVENAYDLVEKLRPQMMRSRASTFGAVREDGTQGGQQITVQAFVDDIRLGELTNLRTVPATTVHEIRYISATDATQRWGTGYMSGVVQVITKK